MRACLEYSGDAAFNSDVKGRAWLKISRALIGPLSINNFLECPKSRPGKCFLISGPVAPGQKPSSPLTCQRPVLLVLEHQTVPLHFTTR